MSSPVTEVRFELVIDGKRKRMIFFQPEKIAELLASDESLGAFLRDMRDATLAAPVTTAKVG